MSDLNGLLLVDKPSGCTSHDVVARVRRIFKMKAVGHTGTLDPLASGLMVVLLGQATKLSDFILSQDKRYEVDIRLGVTSDTGDRDGLISEPVAVQVTEEQVKEVLHGVLGTLTLELPIYSAAKINGKKLYEYARAEQEVVLPKKPMHFYDLKILKIEGDLIRAGVSCSKGSFIRSWVTEIGRRLGTGAIVQELRRTVSAPFGVEEAKVLETIQELAKVADQGGMPLGGSFKGLMEALPGWSQCTVKGKDLFLLKNGQISYDLANRLVVQQKMAHSTGQNQGIKMVGEMGQLLGLVEATPSQGLKIRRIFPIEVQ